MKKLILTSVLAALCLNFSAFAQSGSAQALRPGDPLPALTFTRLSNTKARSISTKDYRNQLIIFDFWATWCSSCIKLFPEVERLQQQYKGRVRFIAVNSRSTKDSEAKVKAFFSRHPEFTFPSITDDTRLDELFPHHAIPHYAWVRNDTVLAVTGPEAIHPDTIAAALAGTIKPATTEERTTDITRPIFHRGNGGEPERYLYRSLLTPYTPGLQSYVSRSTDANGNISRLLYANQSILGLLSAAYPELARAIPSQITTGEGVAESILTDSTTSAWNAKHRYVYEAIFPPRPLSAAQQLMQDDLRRYFGMAIDSALTERDCLVFTKSQEKPRKATKATAATNWYNQEFGSPVTFTYYPVNDLLSCLNEVSRLPLVDETGSTIPVTVQFPNDHPSEAELQQQLGSQGITVSKASRLLKVYIIHKVPN